MSWECKKWAELLLEPEEALSEQDSSRLASHLASCPSCAHERELFLQSWLIFTEAQNKIEIEPSSMLRAVVWEQIRQEQSKLSPPLYLQGKLISITKTFAVLLLGLSLGKYLSTVTIRDDSHLQISSTPYEPALDPDLIKLASQDGFSLELFPESAPQHLVYHSKKKTSADPTQIAKPTQWPSIQAGSTTSIKYVSGSAKSVRYSPYTSSAPSE